MSTQIKTACPLDCYDACAFLATVDDGRVVKLEGNPEHPITRGTICGRGRRLVDRLYAADRLLTPRKRTPMGWEDISWSQALDEITAEIRRTLSEDGHHGLMHCYDWGSGTVLKNLNQRFFYALGGGTETVGSLCWDAGLKAQNYDFGQARSHAPEDLLNSSVIVLWGRNAPVTNMHMMPFIRAALDAGARLVVINPLPTDVDRRAHLRITPRPGTDGALAFAVLKLCIEHRWLDTEFLATRSTGWTELVTVLAKTSVAELLRECEVGLEQAEQLADWYGRGGPVATLLGIGLQRYAGGGQAVRCIDALAAATGQVGKPGGGVQYANREMGQYFDQDILSRRHGADVREFSRGRLAEALETAEPPISTMFVTRTNPLTQVPNTKRLERALAKVRCKVVIDQFMTRTAEFADYVLPCTNVLEEEDIAFTTMWHSFAGYVHPVVPARGEAKPDWQIFRELALRMGVGEVYDGWPELWLRQAFQPLEDAGENFNQFREKGFVQTPTSDVCFGDGDFPTPSGRFEFYSTRAEADGHPSTATYVAPARKRGEYPLTLISSHPRKSENSQHADFPLLPKMPTIVLHRDAARARNIEAGDIVRVFNERGSMKAIAALFEDGNRDAVLLESGWWSSTQTINDLTPNTLADLGDQSAQYDCECEVHLVTTTNDDE
ncbi:MAG: molybdopterin-dependent oxidoreductase [Alicyclobacillaceae bacterium]|nr:molybdopterin-dependent oxidoreductase [Alicyclobacillaceae bacterium]